MVQITLKHFKNKSKGAQEAHEAIRPTDLKRDKVTVEYDQMRLYELIWKRTIASQMSDAKLERTVLKINADQHSEVFTARGEILTFEGFLKVYLEGVDDDEEEAQGILPPVVQGEELNLKSLISTQRFSRPPYRFTEASLVKNSKSLVLVDLLPMHQRFLLYRIEDILQREPLKEHNVPTNNFHLKMMKSL